MLQRGRDADYRGQKTPYDWSRLVYIVRRGRPDALTVLQDAIHEYFGRQFEKAQKEAREKDRVAYYYDNDEREVRVPAKEQLVLFFPRRARQRFLRVSDPRSSLARAPFEVLSAELYRKGYMLSGWVGTQPVVVIWSSRTGNTVRQHLLRRRLLRPAFGEPTDEGIQWHADDPKHVRGLVRRDERLR